MRLYAQSSASGGSQTAEFQQELSVNSAYNLATGQFAAVADSLSETFELSFTNLGSSELTGFYSFGVTMGGNAFANMLLVPEPESYALMLAGLVSIAAWARRQR